jgi:uncharacterized RDD family membrane protein YckC
LTETQSGPVHDIAEIPTQAPTPESAGSRPCEPLETLGGYRVLRRLGGGGMGTVYEAEELATGRRVALKVIAPDYAAAPEAVDRFRQEGRLASLIGHPRCVFVLAVDEDAGRPYIVMELVPGATLHDLIKERGPLPPEEAIAKILDVIDGLQEAHRLEVIHRDVKPSNCFLEADGRVKVGDFGLAKSLVQEGHLTRTGTFLGTLFFASPEQVRGDSLDPRTDVYSVAATLYYLLTGRAPFQSQDAAATLARIVADPAPSLRTLRPELSPALDKVVLRGLERDRERRWPDLESFRQALLALVPAPLTGGDLLRRAVALLVDGLVLGLVAVVLALALGKLLFREMPAPQAESLQAGLAQILFAGLGFLYFALLEGFSGCSLGKGLVKLRVCASKDGEPLTGKQALGRSALFTIFVLLGFVIAGGLRVAADAVDLAWIAPVSGLAPLWAVVGLGVLAATMRKGNGYRGLHEILSSSRVVGMPWPQRHQATPQTSPWLLYFLAARRLSQEIPPRHTFPERIGGFMIRGALKWTATDKILLGEDASLGRRVFLWLRPLSAPPLDRTRRDVGRRTRLRWLGSGKLGELQWDAILAPGGCPLANLVQTEGRLPWREVRPILTELAGELAAACADGTVPRSLSPGQVWVQADGRVQLVDTSLADEVADPDSPTIPNQARALRLLHQVAVLALEGQPRAPEQATAPLRVRLPAPVRGLLDRLAAGPNGYQTVQQFQEDLTALGPGESRREAT